MQRDSALQVCGQAGVGPQVEVVVASWLCVRKKAVAIRLF